MEKTLSAGDVVIKKHEISQNLFFINKGKVRIEFEDTMCYLGENDFFGEEGVFLKKPSIYTAIARDEVVINILTSQEAKTFLSQMPEKALQMIYKNVAQAYNKHDILSEQSELYKNLLEIIYTHLPGDQEKNVKVDLSLMNLAEITELSIPSLRSIFSVVEEWGDIYLSDDSTIMVPFRTYLEKRLFDMSIKKYFSFSPNKFGWGKFTIYNDFIN